MPIKMPSIPRREEAEIRANLPVASLGVRPVPGPAKAPEPGEIDLDTGPDEIDLSAPDEIDLDTASAPWEAESEVNDNERMASIFQAAEREAGDDYDQALGVAEVSGLPVNVVRSQLPAFQAAIRASKRDPAAFSQKYPGLRDLILQQPQIAPTVLRDPAVLRVEETMAPTFDPDTVSGDVGEEIEKSARSPMRLALGKGVLQSELERLWGPIAMAKRKPTADEIARDSEIALEMQAIEERRPKRGFLMGMPEAAMEQLPRMVENAGEISQHAALGLTVGAVAGSAIPVIGPVAGGIYGLQSGMASGVAVTTGRSEGAMYYRDQLMKGADPEAANVRANWVGLITGGLEAANLDKIVRLVPGAKALLRQTPDFWKRLVEREDATGVLLRTAGRWGEGMGSEGLVEALQALVPIYNEEKQFGGDTTDALVAMWEDVTAPAGKSQTRESAAAGAQAGGGMTIVSPGLWIEAGTELDAAETAVKREKVWKALAEALHGSTALKAIPETAKVFLSSALERYGWAPQVSLPAEALKKLIATEGMQEEIEQDMPEVARQLADAGPEDEVVVATQDLLSHVAVKAGFANLTPDLRIGDNPTAREEPQVKARAEQIMKEMEEQAKAAKEAEGKPADPKSGRYVFEGVRARLLELMDADGKPLFDQKTADINAALWQAFAESRSSRLGTDPVSYFRGLRVSFDVGEHSGLTKKEQAKALAQADEERAAEVAAVETPTGFTIATPGKAPIPLTKLSEKDTGGKPRKDVAHAGLAPPEDFTKWRPGQGTPPVQPQERGAAQPSQGERPSAVGPTSPLTGLAKDLYKELWATEPTPVEIMATEDIDTLFQAGKLPKANVITEVTQEGLDPDFDGLMRSAWFSPDGKILLMPPDGNHASIEGFIGKEKANAEDGPFGSRYSDTMKADGWIAGYGMAEGGRMFFWERNAVQRSFQKNGSIVRGFFYSPPSREFFKITLSGKHTNLSTFLHESGHAFLAILERDAMTDPRSAEELRIVREWLGAKGKRKLTREQLESWARGVEGYMWEGKAPSAKLIEVFNSFMAWLRRIYATFRKLDVELSDEVRGVMDRMLATDIEIENAKNLLGLTPPESQADLAGMTPEAYATYRATFEHAFDVARAQAIRDSLRQTRWALADEYERHKEEARTRAKTNKALNARAAILDGKRLDGATLDPVIAGNKLSRDWIKRWVPDLDADSRRRVWPLTVREGGVNPDLAAGLLNYKDGAELVADLARTPALERWVEAEADLRMQADHPGYVPTKRWEQENAQRALHIDAVSNAIWAGHKASKVTLLAIKEIARQRVAAMQVMELTTGRLTREEARAAEEWAEAVKGKDMRAAFDAERRRLLAHHTWREVDAAAQRVEKIVRELRKYQQDKKLRGKIAKAKPTALEAIDGILDAVELGGAAKGKVAEAAAALAALQAEGLSGTMDPERLKLARNYRAMKLGDLETVYDGVRSIAHAALKANQAEVKAEKIEWNRFIDRLVAHIQANRPKLDKAKFPNANPYGSDKSRNLYRDGISYLRKVEILLRELDGGETAGFAHDVIFAGLADAEAAENVMFKELHEKLGKLLGKLAFFDRFMHDHKVVFLTKTISVRDAMTIALNLRNEGNTERLLRSEGWELQAVLDRLGEILTAEDVKLINEFGALVESYWPQIKEVHERVNGVPPKKIIGRSVKLTLKDGTETTIDGGYYPVIRRPGKKSDPAEGTPPEPSENDLWTADFMPNVVGHEFTEERARHAATPLHLSLDALPHHLVRVVHYITHYEVTRKVDRIIQNQKVANAIIDGLGEEAYGLLRPWLKDIVQDRVSGGDVFKMPEKVAQHSRMGATAVLLGVRAVVAIMQTLGFITSAAELQRTKGRLVNPLPIKSGRLIGHGIREHLKAIAAWGKGGPGPFEAIMEKDPTFILHLENWDRDMRHMYRRLTSAYSEFGRFARGMAWLNFAMFNLVQGTVNAITWHAAKQKALEEGHGDPRAYAASTVRLSQSAGGPKDLSLWQRGGEWKKIFSVMFSYKNLVFNLMTERLPTGMNGAEKTMSRVVQAWYLIILPAVLVVLMRQDWEDDTPEEFGWRVAKEAGSFSASTLPVLDKFFSAGVTGRTPAEAPWIRHFEDVAKTAGKMSSTIYDNPTEPWVAIEDLTDADIERLLLGAGTALHLPAKAGIDTWKYFDQLESMEDPGMNWWLRTPKDYR